jgi:xanthine/uracil permease
MAFGWKLYGDGRTPPVGQAVAPEERLSWPRTIGFGAQHVVAMFGGTFVFPIVMGLDPNLALMMSGIGTIIFLLVVANPINLAPLAAGIIIGIGDITLVFTDTFSLTGIALGTIVAVGGWHLARVLAPAHMQQALEGERTGIDDGSLDAVGGADPSSMDTAAARPVG